MTIKEGQIFESERYGGLYVVTLVYNGKVHCLFNDGFVTKDYKMYFNTDKLIAKYPTWQEAVNSNEFNE